MPVEHHPVHPLTIVSERYDACQKKERQGGYWARNVSYKVTPPKDVWIYVNDNMSKECRYDMSLTDPKCAGCTQQGSGERYDKIVRSAGT